MPVEICVRLKPLGDAVVFETGIPPSLEVGVSRQQPGQLKLELKLIWQYKQEEVTRMCTYTFTIYAGQKLIAYSIQGVETYIFMSQPAI